MTLPTPILMRRRAGRWAGPVIDTALRYTPIYGQSLSIGTAPGVAAVVSTASAKDYMFAAGVRAHIDQLALGANENSPINPAGLQSIVPLQEQISSQDANFGETVASGLGANVTGRHLFATTGRGAYPISTLDRDAGGVATDQNHWVNTHAAAMYAADAAAANGWTLEVPFILWLHGSADALAMTPRADYAAAEVALRDDFRAMLSAATGLDASAVPMITEQVSYRQDTSNVGTGDTATGYGSIAVAKIQNHRAGLTVCSGPRYGYEFADSGNLHMSSQGYHDWGAGNLARAAQTVEGGSTFHPTHIYAQPTRSGTTITVPIRTSAGALIHDTTTFAARGFVNDGFDYTGANITGVTITADGASTGLAEIQITLDAAAGGVLRLAYENAKFSVRNEIGCNFRDESGNWACTDEWSVA